MADMLAILRATQSAARASNAMPGIARLMRDARRAGDHATAERHAKRWDRALARWNKALDVLRDADNRLPGDR